MATEKAFKISYETLVKMIPFVLDFLDLDTEEILASGILDDDYISETVITMLLSHKASKSESTEFVSNEQTTTKSEDCQQTTPQHVSQAHSTESEEQCNFLASVPTILPDDFRFHFRMTSSMFEMLLQNMMMLTSFSSLRKNSCSLMMGKGDQISQPAGMLLLTLKFLGCKQAISQLGDCTNMSENILYDIIVKTVSALYELMQYYIKWPTEEHAQEIETSFKQKSHLDKVLGAIDVLHIAVKAPDQQSTYYTNLQGVTTVLLQTVCDHELRFLHCCTGWPGSVDDSAVFLDCDLYSDASKNVDTYFPNGAYLVGDESFPLTDWLIKPFDEDNTLTVSQQHFNTACQEVMKHSTAAYTLLLQRFPRLDYVDVRDMQTMVVVILVCCALHNFCLDCGDKQPFSDAAVTVRNINTPPASGMPKRTALGEERQQILQKLFILHS